MIELLDSSASRQARAVRSKEVSSSELVEAHLDRIEKVNPRLNAVVQMAADRALEAARAADAALKRGQIQGPLHGVPVTFKDAIETGGIVSTGGTLGRRSYVPGEDAEVVRRLRAAGAIVLGKTNCPELGWAWESDNLVYGRTNNPFNLSLSPGGSSGGEAAIIAAGGSPLGLGSDAGGSVRFPAYCCGITAIKPTSGRVPRTGHFPGPGGTLDALWQIGPLARFVEDLSLALKIISGAGWHDTAIVPMPLRDPKAVKIPELRVAFFTDNGIEAPSAEIAEAVRKAAEALRGAGAQVEEARPPVMQETYEIYLGLFCADGGTGLRDLLEAAGTTDSHPLMQRVLALQRSHALTLREYGALVGRWDAYRQGMLSFMEGYDVILSPVCSFAGMAHGSTYDRLPAFSYTMAYNLTGWPAAAVPVDATPEGLPLGVQLAARPWREEVALAAAQHLETSLGGWQKPPL